MNNLKSIREEFKKRFKGEACFASDEVWSFFETQLKKEYEKALNEL